MRKNHEKNVENREKKDKYIEKSSKMLKNCDKTV